MPRTRVYQGRLRWPGVVLPPEPPSGEVFGPDNTVGTIDQRAQAVRDGAGARVVSDPGGAVSFTSPSDFETKLAANPNNTVFVAANSMTWAQMVQTGTTKAPRIWIPTGRVMNLNGFANTALVMGSGELHGGEWINGGGEQAPVTCQGAGALGTGPATLIQDIICHDNFGKGFNNAHSDATWDHCTTYNNGRYGFGSNQNQALGSGSYNTNVTFQFILCHTNNTRNLPTDGDAGGNKILHSFPTIVRSCWFHHNTGAGLWMDYNPGNHTIEDNVSELNTKWGIFYEVGTSYFDGPWKAEANIHHNYLKNNSTSGGGSWFGEVEILSSCSDGAYNGGIGHEIHHNYIDSNQRAVGFVDHNAHPLGVRKCHVHDNDVWIRTTTTDRVGGFWSTTSGTFNHGFDPFAASSDNTFENNHYHVPVGQLGAAYWRWAGVLRTFAQWQSLGHDNAGSLETI